MLTGLDSVIVVKDIRINLLPWREASRQRQRREFLQILILALMLAVTIVGSIGGYYIRAIDRQKQRNQFLETELGVLAVRIEEVNQVRQKSDELLARMKVIQSLQGHRPIIVRVFDELARQLAPDVFFIRLALAATDEGNILTLVGVARSSNRVSMQLRNFSDSDWFDQPSVTAIKAAPEHGPRASQFELSVRQVTPLKQPGLSGE